MKAFAVPLAAVIALALVVISGTAFLAFQPASPEEYQENNDARTICPTITAANCRIVPGVTQGADTDSPTGVKKTRQGLEKEDSCSGMGAVPLTASPMNPEDVGVVIPMGAMIWNHVTPIDHMYFQPTVFHSPPDTYGVYADADGIIDGIGVEPLSAENQGVKIRLTIRHTCDFYSIYNLLTSLSPRLQDIAGDLKPGEYYQKPIPVKAGELLGKIGGQTLDLSVNYDAITLPGFLVPEHYAGEDWKLHTVDPFDYFVEPFKSQLLAKNLRRVAPPGGKIDYDIDGKLVGTWFVEGSGGYPAGYVPDVWKNHVSFAYDHIDPTHIIVSLGNYSDVATATGLAASQNGFMLQYGVKGNAPDPKDVSVSSGVVEYELVNSDYLRSNGQSWDRMSFASDLVAVNQNQVQGVVFVQLISDRKLKLEIFPGKTDADVSGFTVNAKVYER